MKKPRLTIVLLVALLGLTSACDQKTSSNRKTTGSNPSTDPNYVYPTPVPTTAPVITNPDGGPTTCPYGTGDEAGIADAGQTIEYYRVGQPVVLRGEYASLATQWSSLTHMTSLPQSVLYTDNRLNIRIIPRRVNQGTVDARGKTCTYSAVNWTKLSVGLKIRSQESSTGYFYEFQEVPVGCASKVHPVSWIPSSSNPLAIEVTSLKWDGGCIDYANRGYPNHPSACPTANVWVNDCVSFQLQFSTDYTKDIPGPRAY
jgi:hypothetical protein